MFEEDKEYISDTIVSLTNPMFHLIPSHGSKHAEMVPEALMEFVIDAMLAVSFTLDLEKHYEFQRKNFDPDPLLMVFYTFLKLGHS